MKFPKLNRQDKQQIKEIIKYFKSRNTKCAVCLYEGEYSGTNHVHHIVDSITNMKIETPGNYLPICFTCHEKIHRLKRHEMIEKGMKIKMWFEIRKAKGGFD